MVDTRARISHINRVLMPCEGLADANLGQSASYYYGHEKNSIVKEAV